MPERSMNIQEKLEIIKSLGTKKLYDDIQQAELELQRTLNDELLFKSQNIEYLPGRSDDCNAVKKRLMELSMEAPKNEDGKKMTVDQTKAWLDRQRQDDKELSDAIQKQRMAEFTSGDFNIKIETLRSKLSNLRALMSLRTAQITFFCGDVRTTLPLEDEIIEEAKK